MGIKDLLRFMKPYIAPIHIKKYSGKRVGIDAYSWLHKGAYSCSMELAINPRCEKAKQYLSYFMHHINMLRHHDVIPVVVFDGGNLPCKSGTEDERRRKRDANLALAKEKLDEGNLNAAVEFFQRAVNITPLMVYQLIQILRMENVEFVVAPYEADAQLAYMSSLQSDRGISAVITEDSDLVAYGCQSIIFKMDRFGNGEEITMDNVFNSIPNGPSFKHLNIELFTGMCVLAGCDFLSSVPGIGIKRSYSLVSKYRNLDRVLSVLKFDKKHQVPPDYSESFTKAIAVFHHARIFDVETKELKLMKPLPDKLLQSLNGNLDILGPELPPSVAAGVAEGHLDPITLKAFDCSPKLDIQLDLVSVKIYNHIPGHESQVSSQESCFTIFSSSEMSREKITGTDQATLGNIKYSNEALTLRKLFGPLKDRQKEEIKEERLTTPNNNPFKRRKLDDVESGRGESMEEQVSVVTEAEKSEDVISGSPDSQESVKSKAVVRYPIGKDQSEKTLKAKSKCIATATKKSGILGFFTRISS